MSNKKHSKVYIGLHTNLSMSFPPSPRFVREMWVVHFYYSLTLFVVSLSGPQKPGQIETEMDTRTLVQALRYMHVMKPTGCTIYLQFIQSLYLYMIWAW
jgi:hypothetical protein